MLNRANGVEWMNRSPAKTALHIVAAIAVAAVGVGLLAAPAGAVPGQTDTGSTTANVTVGSAISLTGLTPTFTLTGIPGVAVTGTSAVSMLVTTNNFAGYTVTVEPQTATLTGAIPGNTDTIPIGSLQVQGPTQVDAFAALTFGTPTEVVTKAAPSAEAGDTVNNSYRMTVPFVQPDTYTATLDYIATTL
jgi:hypothetical protein